MGNKFETQAATHEQSDRIVQSIINRLEDSSKPFDLKKILKLVEDPHVKTVSLLIKLIGVDGSFVEVISVNYQMGENGVDKVIDCIKKQSPAKSIKEISIQTKALDFDDKEIPDKNFEHILS